MSSTTAELVLELKRLRKGLGLQSPDLSLVLGPQLRAVAGIDNEDPQPVLKQKLERAISDLTTVLPIDLSLIVRVALALEGEGGRQAHLEQRIALLARRFDRDMRTIRRRLDHGLKRLADLMAERIQDVRPNAEGGRPAWFVANMSAVVMLDKPRPEAIETRTIVANRDSLDRLELRYTVPRRQGDRQASHGLEIEALHGGIISAQRHPSESLFTLDFELPRPLQRGDRHEYAIIYRIPRGQAMTPHYIYIPVNPCERFSLTVRFSLDALPRKVWVVPGAFHRQIDEGVSADWVLIPDKVGEVSVELHDLVPGYGYGIKWDEAVNELV